VRELVSSRSFNNLLAKVKVLVKFFEISSVTNEKLRDLCGQVVVKEGPTRWNSVLLLMIDCMLLIRSSLEHVLKQMKQNFLINTEWDRLFDLQRITSPFNQHTNNLQTYIMSMSSVIPAIMELTVTVTEKSQPKLKLKRLN
jgi:hypothetical protein